MRSIVIAIMRAVHALISAWWFAMESVSDWLVGVIVKTEYVRRGSCVRCGRCCRLLAIEMPLWISRRDRLVRLVSFWHRLILNFELEGIDNNLLIYRCRYFIDAASGSAELPRCAIHPYRHRLCRYYPRPRLFGHPKLNPSCGFHFERRDGKPPFDEVLRRAVSGRS